MKKQLILILLIFLISFNTAEAVCKKHKGNNLMTKIEQNAGRKQLGEFAPEFTHYNDDILFGEKSE